MKGKVSFCCGQSENFKMFYKSIAVRIKGITDEKQPKESGFSKCGEEELFFCLWANREFTFLKLKNISEIIYWRCSIKKGNG